VELNRALAQDPNYAMAYYVRGLLYSDHNEDAKAFQDAEKAVALTPESVSARLLLAKVATRLGKCARAVEALQPFATTTTDSQTLFLLGRAYQCAGQAEEAGKAMARYGEASKKDRETAENEAQAGHLVTQAQQEAGANHLKPALELLQQAIEKQSQNSDAYTLMAKIHFSMGSLDDAHREIEQALNINPVQPENFYVLGKILAREGNLDDALEAFRKTTVINPAESDAFYEMGLIYRQKNDKERAVEVLKKALAISPHDPDYRQTLAEITASSESR
jgi:tetratricopeptide (TPR) repeat protein